MRRSRFLSAIALTLLAAGCATSVWPGNGLPRATYRGAVVDTVTFPDAGILVEPPDPNSRAVWSDAFYVDNCTTGHAICDATRGPDVFLASVTLTSAGTQREDGSLEPLLDHTEVFVVQFTDVPCAPVGPMRPDGATRTPETFTCTIFNFLDTDGRVLWSIEGPGLAPLG